MWVHIFSNFQVLSCSQQAELGFLLKSVSLAAAGGDTLFEKNQFDLKTPYKLKI